MAFGNNIVTSIFGRRLGLQIQSSAQSGTAVAGRRFEWLVGPDDLRVGSSAETTSSNLAPHGVSIVNGTSAASSSVYVLDPPVPGVKKYITATSSANGNTYVRTQNSETIMTTFGSSFTTIKTTGTFALELVGITTAIWGGLSITSGTSSNASGFSLTTTT